MSHKILVTGGAGFIGSHVTDELIHKGNEVIVLDDLSGGFRENVNTKAKFIQGSVTDKELVDRIFSEYGFKYIFHLAAYAAEGLSHFIKHFNYENNLMGSIHLINASIRHNITCFVFASSIAVYGEGKLPLKEEADPHPEDPYGIAKYAVELDLKNSQKMFGLNHIIFRPHNVYGERQNIGDKYRNVLGIFMNQIMQGKSLTIFGDGEQKRAFSYIGDIAPIIANSIFNMNAYNQIFNIGADEPVSVNHLAKLISEMLGTQAPITYLSERNEVKFAYSDHTKVKEVFGYDSKISLEEGIRRMAKWAKIAGPRKSKEFKNIEIEKNLPSAWKK